MCVIFHGGRRKEDTLQILFIICIGGISSWSISQGGIRKEGSLPTGTSLVKKGDALFVSSPGTSWWDLCS